MNKKEEKNYKDGIETEWGGVGWGWQETFQENFVDGLDGIK